MVSGSIAVSSSATRTSLGRIDAGEGGCEGFGRGTMIGGLAGDPLGDDESLFGEADRRGLRADVESRSERLNVAGQTRLVEEDAGRDVHAADRGPGVEDDPLDRAARTTNRDRLGHEALDVRPAIDVGVVDHHLDVAARQDRATLPQ